MNHPILMGIGWIALDLEHVLVFSWRPPHKRDHNIRGQRNPWTGATVVKPRIAHTP